MTAIPTPSVQRHSFRAVLRARRGELAPRTCAANGAAGGPPVDDALPVETLDEVTREAHAVLDRMLAAVAAAETRAGSVDQGGVGRTGRGAPGRTSPQAGGASLRARLGEVERLGRRVDAVRLAVLAAAERADVAARTGHTDTGSWAASTTHADRPTQARDVALAIALDAEPPAEEHPTSSGTSGDDGGSGSGEARPEDQPPSGDHGSSEGPAGDGGQIGARGTRQVGAVTAALRQGQISLEHARVITRTLDELPDHATATQRTTCQDRLLQLATTLSPARLRRQARRILTECAPPPPQDLVDAHEDAVLTADEHRAEEQASFWIADNHDGTMTGRFTVPYAAGATLRKIIDAMTAPRRQHHGTGQTTTGTGAAAGTRADAGTHAAAGTDALDLTTRGTSDPAGAPGGLDSGAARPMGAGARTGAERKTAALDWQHRRGLALTDLLHRLPTDHLHNKVAATLLVTTRLDDLRGELTKVGRTDAGEDISAGQTRRLACGAGIVPAVLDGDSQPVDLGTTRRLFTDAQRLALTTRYDSCATDGCDRPFAWTEIHHLTPWQRGGPTDLDNAIPLCGHHHRLIHHPDWQHSRHPESIPGSPTGSGRRRVSIRFHRRT
ncbi:hypothetical protein GCM10027055_12190 [Janibacter alkaliphilus]|uniref:HNH nuclease domain-containing protein n=1 Tax=Janibacter alkaliphilus TaxID=1069963 RepID=A0A852X4G1_9MICO|nr:HNH endonuclease signature motif containing protein [Janibacter alkaliphilus]NYG37789.1 hypothetical protein [Janibacter alkaliphilus]